MERQMNTGDTFTFRGSTLKVEPARREPDGRFSCDGCYNDYACMAGNREDSTNVIFREVRE